MRLSELIETLEKMAEGRDEDVEVFLATQPSWPMANEIACVTDLSTMCPTCEFEVGEEHAGDCDRSGEVEAGVIWIAATSGEPYGESPYAPRVAWSG